MAVALDMGNPLWRVSTLAGDRQVAIRPSSKLPKFVTRNVDHVDNVDRTVYRVAAGQSATAKEQP